MIRRLSARAVQGVTSNVGGLICGTIPSPQVPPPGPTETRRVEWVVQRKWRDEQWKDGLTCDNPEDLKSIASGLRQNGFAARIRKRTTTVTEEEVGDE